MSNKVSIFEVGPRDGLQNEKRFVTTDRKIALIDELSNIGFMHIEAASFVSPKWVPQMADAEQVMKQILRDKNVSYAALTPNLKGYEVAIKSGADEVAIFAAASETFSQKNINCTIEESIDRYKVVARAAERDNIRVRGYISCVAGCPYEGGIDPKSVLDVAMKLQDAGCYQISLGDTIGQGTPEIITRLLEKVIEYIPSEKLAGHYHDTNGRALESVAISLDYGLRAFDSAIGGLGGCPYAPGAAGNISTLKLANMLLEAGWETGLDMEKLFAAHKKALNLFS